MKCEWSKLTALLPPWIRTSLDLDVQQTCQEIRLRLGAPPLLVLQQGTRQLSGTVRQEDLTHVVNMASRYSPWTACSVSEGYLTAPGGHRIGICGDAVIKNGQFSGVRNISSLCIRIARDLPGVAEKLRNCKGSVLILGSPGWGKTTLLRDLIRQRSAQGDQISVADEREELFPLDFPRGSGIDVLSGCPKPQGILMLLKTMGPQIIAVDEITSQADCQALLGAAGCGTELLATAHGSCMDDFMTRPVYKPLVEQRVFDTVVILHRDKSWHLERSREWTANGSAHS